MKYEEIYKKLAELAPNVHFQLEHEHDNSVWDNQWGEQGKLQSYSIDINAKCVDRSEMLTGTAYLSEVWMNPEEPIGDIGGYLPQKLLEAATELLDEVTLPLLKNQLRAVQAFLKQEMRDRWQAQ